ncbi:BglG family transcription antiterminator [Listeria aquatica]|uniref:BglG family transcription antiterminator n=1 Tax=Listeria aquatica TaxID=1494960 RepID=UPI0031F54E0C
MIFSTNESNLLNVLNYETFTSAGELASQLFVSNKTIYRLVKKINDIVQVDYQKPLILSEAGKGYILNPEFININIQQSVDYKEENQLNDLLLSLMYKHPNKKSREAFKFEYVSESTAERLMKKLEERLLCYRINLYMNQDYVWIEGKEQDIRKAIHEIILETHNLNALGEIGIELDEFDKYFLDKQLALLEETIGETINYPYDITLYTHIYMLLKRYREGDVAYLKRQEPLEFDELQLLDTNRRLANVARQIKGNIESYLNLELSEMEEFFIFQNLYSINIQERESSNVDKSLAELISNKLITSFFNISDKSLLPSCRSLYEDIYQHTLPMLSRLRSGITVENNLLEEEKVEYRDTFYKLKAIISEINKELTFETKINEEEIGYLTLYFEKYKLSKNKAKNVLLVCSTGIGTSELLKIRLEKNVQNINIVATMSQRQMKNNKAFLDENIDLILSTLRVPLNSVNLPVLTISPLLTSQDIQKINYMIKET